jgi:predicted CXXCH cytochrome family protein
VCGLLISLGALLIAGTVNAKEPSQPTDEYCLSCHADPDLSVILPSGETLSLYVDPEIHAVSVHTDVGIECHACHADITTYPHPELLYTSARELSRNYYLACQNCHAINYEKTLDSMHAQIAEAGNLDAPVCTDCHSAHYVQEPNNPRSLISETCGQCHTEINETYIASVHGWDLIEEDNPDVPVCTDCHGVHDIQDPRTAQFHVETPELCAHCHADEELMNKYDLSSDVYDIYDLSWHGVDVSVYKARWPTIWHESAVCTDCHGIHNILSAENPKSLVNPDNLLDTCQQCHEGVSPNWVNAWTGHHEISLERTPYLFYVNNFYNTFTYLVLGLSGVYVLLQIVRNTVNRARRST